MDFSHVTTQVMFVFIAAVFLWIFLKTLKIIWKISLVIILFSALSFALPAIREWVLGLF